MPSAAAMKVSSALLLALLLVSPPLPAGERSAGGDDWRDELDAIDALLAGKKWERADKRAGRLGDRILTRAWSSGNARRALAEISLQRAVAASQLGREREALWHWYAAVNLDRSVRARDLGSASLLAELATGPLRAEGSLPEPFEGVGDLELLRLEPPAYAAVEPPDVVPAEAIASFRQPSLLIEAVLDRTGTIRQPVLLTDEAHPVMIYAAFAWLAEIPPAVPARLDGRPVDSLQLFDIDFSVGRDSGMVYLPPPQD